MDSQDIMKQGVVYWITGLSGAGKTTVGKLLTNKLKTKKSNVVFLDGDILRSVFGTQTGYTPKERLDLAMRYSRLCQMLAMQEIDVVCATISMFHEVRNWNRESIPNYKEVYLKAPIKLLIERDQKQLYSRALNGEINNVMGVDVPIEEPTNPDLIINIDKNLTAKNIVETLIKTL